MTNGPFYTYHRIHSTSGNAHFMDICMYVCLSVCLSFCHIPFVRSILERSRKLYFSEQVAPHASEWWRNSKIKRSTVKVTGNTKMKKKSFSRKNWIDLLTSNQDQNEQGSIRHLSSNTFH